MARHDELQEAFEAQGYEVSDVSENRDRVLLTLREADAPASELREIVEEVVGEDALGLNVTNESLEGGDTVGTVVSYRTRR